MPATDTCISSVYEPGNIPASPGLPPLVPIVPSFIDPNNYDPSALTYSLHFARFYDSPYHHDGTH